MQQQVLKHSRHLHTCAVQSLPWWWHLAPPHGQLWQDRVTNWWNSEPRKSDSIILIYTVIYFCLSKRWKVCCALCYKMLLLQFYGEEEIFTCRLCVPTQTLFCSNWPQRTAQSDTVQLCLHVADPATFLAPHSVLWTSFSSENSLFIQLWKHSTRISAFLLSPHSFFNSNIKIQSLNFFSERLRLRAWLQKSHFGSYLLTEGAFGLMRVILLALAVIVVVNLLWFLAGKSERAALWTQRAAVPCTCFTSQPEIKAG